MSRPSDEHVKQVLKVQHITDLQACQIYLCAQIKNRLQKAQLVFRNSGEGDHKIFLDGFGHLKEGTSVTRVGQAVADYAVSCGYAPMWVRFSAYAHMRTCAGSAY